MASYLVSFRIADDADYSDRWSSTVSAIHSEADDRSYWEETTSLIVLNSNKTPADLALSVYLGSKFNSTKDTMLVVNANTGMYATQGKVNYPNTLASLFSRNTFVGNALARGFSG